MKDGHKARIELRLRGRERAHKDLAREKLNAFIEMIPMELKKEEEAKKNPRGIAVTVCPVLQSRQAPKGSQESSSGQD